MKDELTVGDLLEEGRRYVFSVGRHYEGEGYRAIIVFEDYPGYFLTGELTNSADAVPVVWWKTDDREQADQMAYDHSEKMLGLSKIEHLKIIASSIGSQYKSGNVKVNYDPDSGRVLLMNASIEMQLEEEQAEKLYQDLAKALNLPYRDNCTECGHMLDDLAECPNCD